MNFVIVGIDAGLTAPGIAAVEVEQNSSLKPGRVLNAACLQTGLNPASFARTTEYDAARIGLIVTRLANFMDLYRPTVIVAELPTGGAKDANGIKGMAMATAMAVSAITFYTRQASTDIQVSYITPMQNKKGSMGKLRKAKTDEDKAQGKWNVMAAVNKIWPGINWPKQKRGQDLDKTTCWAMADALSCVATWLRMHKAELPNLEGQF